MMRKGQQYIVGLQSAPEKTPKNGGWTQIRYFNPERTKQVLPVVTTQSPWAKSVHIYAMENGPKPVLRQDELVYRNEEGEGESRVIVSFTEL